MSTAAVEAWREQIRAKREANEARWAELNNAAEAMLAQLQTGQLAEAHDSASLACDIEHELIGDCDLTSRLCEAVGLGDSD